MLYVCNCIRTYMCNATLPLVLLDFVHAVRRTQRRCQWNADPSLCFARMPFFQAVGLGNDESLDRPGKQSTIGKHSRQFTKPFLHGGPERSDLNLCTKDERFRVTMLLHSSRKKQHARCNRVFFGNTSSCRVCLMHLS